jgi:hypothetical protein
MAVSVTQCEDTIPGSFARVVGNLGTSKTCQTVKPRSSGENFRHIPPSNTTWLQYSYHELIENLKLTQSKRWYRNWGDRIRTRVTRLTRDTLVSNTSANISSCSAVFMKMLEEGISSKNCQHFTYCLFSCIVLSPCPRRVKLVPSKSNVTLTWSRKIPAKSYFEELFWRVIWSQTTLGV